MIDTYRYNPVSTRQGEGPDQKYIKIRKDDGIIVRHEEQMDWAKKFKLTKGQKWKNAIFP